MKPATISVTILVVLAGLLSTTQGSPIEFVHSAASAVGRENIDRTVSHVRNLISSVIVADAKTRDSSIKALAGDAFNVATALVFNPNSPIDAKWRSRLTNEMTKFATGALMNNLNRH